MARRQTIKTDAPIEQKPPDSLGQAFIHLLWPMRPLWRNLLLSIAGASVLGFVIWSVLPQETQKAFIEKLARSMSNEQLSPEQVSDRNYYEFLGDKLANSRPEQALEHYRKALKIDPQNQEIRMKVEQLQEKQMRGGSK